MANDGQIVFEVTADGKHAIADIKEITRAIQTETKNWDAAAKQSTDSMGSSFDGLLKKLVAGFSAAKIGQALLNFGKDALEAASALEEVQNVVDVTFGSNANQIETWAKNASAQFGLTETMAKKFASTMGAMLKSSGMTSGEITKVSTDLAGLAADMASFYNLDFEEAFAKIRSGISGQTMPLKELGIDMSNATLNAFALKQGLTKTFDQMSQSEQTMLRYQYLMQATADAQGDFARTSDGYANSMRQLESNIDALKTTLGKPFLDTVASAVQALNGFLQLLIPEEKATTVLDDFANIDLKTEEKLAKIQATAEQAKLLTDELDKIGGSKADAAGSKVQQIVDGLSKVNLNQDKTKIVKDFVSTLASDTETLANLTGKDAAGVSEWLKQIGEAADKLDPNDAAGWQQLISTIKQGLPGIENTSFGQDFFAALEGIKIGDKAQAVKTFIADLSQNIDKVAALKGTDAEGAKAWLNEIGAAAEALSPEDAAGWEKLINSIKEGLPGLEDTEFGKKFFASLGEGFEEIGGKSDLLDWALTALGDKTNKTAEEQAYWLEICKNLVNTIPGLSSIINTETGEIKGGTKAVREYIKAWEEGQTRLALLGALEQKEAAYAERFANLPSLELDMALAKRRARQAYKELQDIANKYGISPDDQGGYGFMFTANYADYDEAIRKYQQLKDEADKATEAYNLQKDALEEAKQALKEYRQAIEEEYGSVEEARKAGVEWSEEMQENARIVTEAAKTSIQALKDYVKGVRDSVEKSVDGIVKGFNKIGKAGDDLRQKSSDAQDEWQKAITKYSSVVSKYMNSDGTVNLKKMSDEYESLTKEEQAAYNELAKIYNKQKEINEGLKNYSTQGMKDNLDSQIVYMQEYIDNLDKARKMGLSNELLASLSDGTQESAEILAGLVAGGEEAAKEVDKKFQEVQAKKKEFTDQLTAQQLTVDQVYAQMAAEAKAAVEALDLEEEAKDNSGKTIKGLAQGISDHVSDVQTAVDSIISELDRLSSWGISIDLGDFGSINFQFPTSESTAGILGSFASGLDFVPRDGFAYIHEGEGILTAEENKVWQQFKNRGSNSFDYDAMGGVMRDNIKPGGNVYLDGRVVGSVISEQQGRSYRQLQRSGWQG